MLFHSEAPLFLWVEAFSSIDWHHSQVFDKGVF